MLLSTVFCDMSTSLKNENCHEGYDGALVQRMFRTKPTNPNADIAAPTGGTIYAPISDDVPTPSRKASRAHCFRSSICAPIAP